MQLPPGAPALPTTKSCHDTGPSGISRFRARLKYYRTRSRRALATPFRLRAFFAKTHRGTQGAMTPSGAIPLPTPRPRLETGQKRGDGLGQLPGSSHPQTQTHAPTAKASLTVRLAAVADVSRDLLRACIPTR